MSLGVHYKAPGSARVSRVGDRVLAIMDFLSDALLRKDFFGGTPKPAHETRALPAPLQMETPR